MWTTWGPGVCQQALFTKTSFQPLFGVVPICSPSRPESNAHHARLTTVLGGFTRVARSSCWSQPTCSTTRSLQQPQLCRATAYLSWSLTHFLSTSARLILTLFNTMNYGRCSFCCRMAINGMGTDVPHPPRWWPKACMGRRSLRLTRPSAELAGHGADLHSHLNPKSHLA